MVEVVADETVVFEVIVARVIVDRVVVFERLVLRVIVDEVVDKKVAIEGIVDSVLIVLEI